MMSEDVYHLPGIYKEKVVRKNSYVSHGPCDSLSFVVSFSNVTYKYHVNEEYDSQVSSSVSLSSVWDPSSVKGPCHIRVPFMIYLSTVIKGREDVQGLLNLLTGENFYVVKCLSCTQSFWYWMRSLGIPSIVNGCDSRNNGGTLSVLLKLK